MNADEAQQIQMIITKSIPIVAILSMCGVFVVGIVVGGVRRMVVERAREQSRREVAAYVAEGTLSPDDAVKILNAGKRSSSCGSSTGA
ncbi:MAG: hypothetical protein HRU70_02260 [Phycisphaeraceae bacterium]|nr:MAG: hypothetical protein HRU70_02260 [Phycisphaeraceae bacterium]